jgi:hypothetical protein
MAQMENRTPGISPPKRNGPPILASLHKPMENIQQDRPKHSHMGALHNWNFFNQRSLLFVGNYHDQAKDTIWGKIWNSILCPKVSIFLWLIVQNRIFAWVILKKRGFIGPSIFLLFQQHEETMEHVFNHFHYNHTIWDLESQIMRRSNRNMNIINNTIENWDSITF